MTLPVPPSDSLYKFTAVGGLILIVLSLYVPWKMDLDLKIAALEIELENSNAELKHMDMEVLDEQIDDTLKVIDGATKNLGEKMQLLESEVRELGKIIDAKSKKISPPPQKLNFEVERVRNGHNVRELEQIMSELEQKKSELKQASRLTEQLKAKSYEWTLLKMQSLHEADKLNVLGIQAARLGWISLFTLCIGIMMTVLGFWNWYYRFQIYQDRIIKAQAEQLNA